MGEVLVDRLWSDTNEKKKEAPYWTETNGRQQEGDCPDGCKLSTLDQVSGTGFVSEKKKTTKTIDFS